MSFQPQLQFLQTAFKKCGVPLFFIDPRSREQAVKDLFGALGKPAYFQSVFRKMLERVKPRTLYLATDPFLLSFMFLLLPETESVLVIGPYLSVTLTRQERLAYLEQQSLHPEHFHLLESFYGTLPLLTTGDSVFPFVHTFCETLWGREYKVQDINADILSASPPVNHKTEYEDATLKLRLAERRYSYENEVMQAVRLGAYPRAAALMQGFASVPLEQRHADPIRNMKNYCIILNTLLRKAAEEGGVHPLQLDQTSSAFAGRIENVTSSQQIPKLMEDMLRAYCNLVKQGTVLSYSPLVQQVVVLMDTDLSSDLSLKALARQLNVNASYLSSLFKKETGKTLTDFATERRIQAACQLLGTSGLQIQTVARYCGIPDSNYFSKIFKKLTGMTPSEYRQTALHHWKTPQ